MLNFDPSSMVMVFIFLKENQIISQIPRQYHGFKNYCFLGGRIGYKLIFLKKTLNQDNNKFLKNYFFFQN